MGRGDAAQIFGIILGDGDNDYRIVAVGPQLGKMQFFVLHPAFLLPGGEHIQEFIVMGPAAPGFVEAAVEGYPIAGGVGDNADFGMKDAGGMEGDFHFQAVVFDQPGQQVQIGLALDIGGVHPSQILRRGQGEEEFPGLQAAGDDSLHQGGVQFFVANQADAAAVAEEAGNAGGGGGQAVGAESVGGPVVAHRRRQGRGVKAGNQIRAGVRSVAGGQGQSAQGHSAAPAALAAVKPARTPCCGRGVGSA